MSRFSLLAIVFCAGALAALLPAAASASSLSPSGSLVLFLEDPAFQSGEQGGEDTGSAPAEAGETGGKSRAKALALSTLLPGAGEYYAGKKERAKAFFLAEAAIWTGFIVFEVQGHLRKDSYIEYAGLMAGADAEGKPEDYCRALGQYARSDPGPGSYNEDVRREARALYPDDRQRQDEYVQQNGYFGDDAWDWQSQEDQARYRSLRRKSLLSFRRATYMLGVAAAARILSAMDAARSVVRASDAPGKPLGLKLELRPDETSPSSVMVCLSKSF
ncbi:MAG: hypothetical protein V2A71_00120 [Candidatus Eisenbacteria bacterium]